MRLDDVEGRPRYLSYCTNVHPGETVDEILRALSQFTVPLQRRLVGDAPFAVGLRLGQVAIDTLRDEPPALERFEGFLRRHDLVAYTLNTFAQSPFHEAAVKDRIYQPDWTSAARADFTLDAARLLARLLPSGATFGTLSTVPVGFQRHAGGQEDLGAERLAVLAGRLALLESQSGVRIMVCLEPEPLCVVETTPGLIAFFDRHVLPRARRLPDVDGRSGEEQARRYLGACFDVCHAAVEFEDPSYCLESLARAGIEVGKIQLSSALELRRPNDNAEGLRRLASFAEPRFLHQVIARDARGALRRYADLPEYLESRSDSEGGPEAVRCHFHVPIHLDELFPLHTTHAALLETMNRERVRRGVRHLEVETYTFSVLPRAAAAASHLLDSLEQEIRFAQRHLLATEAPGPHRRPPPH